MTSYQKPLPECDGPKLSPFRVSKARIRFDRLISDPRTEGHGYVFEASINSQVYALKIVGATGSSVHHSRN